MNAKEAKLWKHTSAQSLYELNEENSVIEIYDDEEEDSVSLYFYDGEKRWPVRTIDTTNPVHRDKVLYAWATSHTVVDKRTLHLFPLPWEKSKSLTHC